MQFENIIRQFITEGEVITCERYGSGHINYTYYVVIDKNGVKDEYILQKINTVVFKDPDLLMNNYVAVTSYLKNVIIANGGDPMRETINVIPTVDGKNFYRSENDECWRLLVFVKDNLSYDKVETPEQFRDCAEAFGNFQYVLREFPAETLKETIVNFHNTPDRYNNLMKAVEADVCGRRAEVEAEIEFAKARKAFTETFETAREQGRIPLRVTHNDTKLNNILFDKHTGKAMCVIDLDTIMPGYAMNDFGDSIRFGATTAAEDETDLSKVNFDIKLFEMYVEGFVKGCNGGLTKAEIELLPEGAIMMTLECGMRFLTDYLSGDTYFRIARPSHNIDRARNQFKLVSDMEKSIDDMRAIVAKHSK